MAEYLATEILDCTGPLIRASWASGLGCVPLGFTTYAPNSIEVTWRIIKGLLDKSYCFRGCGALMVDVAAAVDSRFHQGAYRDLVGELTDITRGLCQVIQGGNTYIV